jgi:hypothetical protein
MDTATMLEELSHEAPTRYESNGGKPEIARVKYSHDAMIDLVISDPWIHQNQIAAHFGYTAPWVSIIFSSDAFKERLEMRKAELVDPVIRATLEERSKALVSKSLEVLMEKLSKPNVSDAVALKAYELGAKAVGLGGQGAQVAVTINADHIENLAGRLIQLRGQAYAPHILQGEAREVNS